MTKNGPFLSIESKNGMESKKNRDRNLTGEDFPGYFLEKKALLRDPGTHRGCGKQIPGGLKPRKTQEKSYSHPVLRNPAASSFFSVLFRCDLS